MKCSYCGKEFEKVISGWTCPHCNNPITTTEIEDAVHLILQNKGLSILANSNYFIALLSDLAPRAKKEITLVQLAIEKGVYSEIIAADKKNGTQKKAQLRKSISDLLSSSAFDEPTAQKIINILTTYLGWDPELINQLHANSNPVKKASQLGSFLKPKLILFANVTNIARTIAVVFLIGIVLLFVLLAKSCSNDGPNNIPSGNGNQWTSNLDSTSNTTDDSSNQPSGTESSNNSNNESNAGNSSDAPTKETEGTTSTTTPEPPANETITGTSISGKLTAEDQVISYNYTAPKNGRYRFDFQISDTQANYDVSIKDSQNTTVVSGSYSDSDHGFSAKLEAGKTYIVTVSQDYRLCDYSISIGVPNDVKNITGNSITGSIKYVDQEDFFNYTAPKSGLYRFDFDATDVNANYKVKITDSKNATVGSASYSSSSQGISIRLTAQETYLIEIEQYSLVCDYTISIGVPADTISVTGNEISGAIQYQDQENIYTYVAPRTGLYHFDFDTSDVSANYSFKITNSKNAKVCSTNYSASRLNGATVTLEEGMSYTITVGQDFKTCDYSISIGVPNGVQQVSGNTITGSIAYRDQENTYTYTATQTGTYVFKLGISNKNADYNIKIKTSSNSSKGSGHYAWDYFSGIETNLTAGETYTIIISYEYLTCDYTVDISIKAE